MTPIQKGGVVVLFGSIILGYGIWEYLKLQPEQAEGELPTPPPFPPPPLS